MELTCPSCKETKPETDFYPSKRAKSGRCSWCINCSLSKKRGRENRHISTEMREKLKAYGKEWYEKNKASVLKYQSDRRRSHRFENRAGQAVVRAIRRGELVRQPCEVCSREKTVAHHDDYNFYLKVRWLCQSCHRFWHAENKPIYPN